MLAHRKVEALTEYACPRSNKGSGTSTGGMVKKMYLITPCPVPQQAVWTDKGCVGGEGERNRTPHIPLGKILMSDYPSLIDVDDYCFRPSD
jgi:hypothetical protein